MHKITNLLIVAITTFASNSFAQVTYPVERPTLKVGDSWAYQRTDLWKNEVNPNKTNLKVSSITAEGNYRFAFINLLGAVSNFTNDPDLNGLKYQFQGEDMYRAWNKWPLSDNTAWDFSWKQASNDGSTVVTNKYSCRVSGVEKIKVVAGEFDVVKRSCKGFWSNQLGGSGSMENIDWYAPAAKRAVKSQFKLWFGSTLQTQTLDELVEFKLN